ATVNTLEYRKGSTAGATPCAEHGHISRAITNKWIFSGAEMGHDHFPRLAFADTSALFINNFDENVFGRYVHRSGRTLGGDETRIAGPIAVSNRRPEHLLDDLALVGIEGLPRREGYARTPAFQRDTSGPCMAGESRERGSIAEEHPR